jgi:hypothetical protein
MSSYSDAKYGVIERKWFGLKTLWGGEGSDAGLVTASAETTFVKRWYPQGPIQLEKFGVFTGCTLGATEMVVRLKRTSTVKCTVVCSTSSSAFVIASKAVNCTVAAGSYLAIVASSVSSSTGTFACFVDFRRTYDGGSSVKHDPTY